MKKISFLIAAGLIMAASTVLSSCDREKENIRPQMNESAKMTVKVNTPRTVSYAMLSKASGEHHGQEDSTITNLQLFVFNADNQVESYTKLLSDDLGDDNKYELEVSTGAKTIWAVANSHKVDALASVKTLDELLAICVDLSKENILDFSMVGTSEITVTKSAENNVSLDLTRFVARIHLGTVKTQMTGGYANASLTDVQAYLINAYDEALIGNKKGKSGSIANMDTLVRSDFASYQMENMLYEEPGNITPSGNACDKYFYCYGNPGTAKATKLVIRGLLGGVEYFYPIKISDSTNTDALTANNSINIKNVTIKRPGSKRPSDDVSYDAIDFTISVNDWVELDERDVVF